MTDRGLECKSDTTQTSPAESIEPSAEPLQNSATSPPSPAPGSESATADNVESNFDDMSDCKHQISVYPCKCTNAHSRISGASFISALSALPDSVFLDLDISVDAMQASVESLSLQQTDN